MHSGTSEHCEDLLLDTWLIFKCHSLDKDKRPDGNIWGQNRHHLSGHWPRWTGSVLKAAPWFYFKGV